MATKWPGIVVRCNLGESGDVPRTASATSPDIIISGPEPFPDPGILTDPAKYEKTFDGSLSIGVPNYLYVRGKNFTGAQLAGTWNLFYAPSSILLYPYLWQHNQLATSSGNRNPPFAIKPGDIGASLDAFVWIPPETTGQYCLIAVANTPGHGNPLAGVTNIAELASTLPNNANIAQRNVIVVHGDKPVMMVQVPYDQGNEGCRLDLVLRFQDTPRGSSIMVSAGTRLNGKPLLFQDNDTRDTDFRYGWVDLDIPAHWTTIFEIVIKFGSDWSGIPPGQYPSFSLVGEIPQTSMDRLYHLGGDAGRHPVTKERRLDPAGAPVRVIVVGSVTVMFPDVRPR